MQQDTGCPLPYQVRDKLREHDNHEVMPAQAGIQEPYIQSQAALGTRHGVDLRGPFGQVALGPVLAAILTGEHLPATGRTVHTLGLAFVEGDGKYSGFGFDAHVHSRPVQAAVSAAEQDASVALEIRTSGHPDGLRITRDLADITAVSLPLGVQRLQAGGGPVLPLVGAAEQASTGDGEDRPWTPAPDHDAMHVHGIIVHVVTMTHVLPVLATVEATNDAADFDGTIELVGVHGIGGQLQDALGRIGPGGHSYFWEADGHR